VQVPRILDNNVNPAHNPTQTRQVRQSAILGKRKDNRQKEACIILYYIQDKKKKDTLCRRQRFKGWTLQATVRRGGLSTQPSFSRSCNGATIHLAQPHRQDRKERTAKLSRQLPATLIATIILVSSWTSVAKASSSTNTRRLESSHVTNMHLLIVKTQERRTRRVRNLEDRVAE
jgi:hypothetical protein